MPACRSWFVGHPHPPHHHQHHFHHCHNYHPHHPHQPTNENWLIPKGWPADLGLSVIPILLLLIIIILIIPILLVIILLIIIIVITIILIILPMKMGSFHNAGLQILVCLSRLWSAPELQ